MSKRNLALGSIDCPRCSLYSQKIRDSMLNPKYYPYWYLMVDRSPRHKVGAGGPVLSSYLLSYRAR